MIAEKSEALEAEVQRGGKRMFAAPVVDGCYAQCSGIFEAANSGHRFGADDVLRPLPIFHGALPLSHA